MDKHDWSPVMIAIGAGIVIMFIAYSREYKELQLETWSVKDIVITKVDKEYRSTVFEESTKGNNRESRYYYVPNKVFRSYEGRWFNIETGEKSRFQRLLNEKIRLYIRKEKQK